jgi:poly-gamma-glutamate synthesis protein (capsule biosynthesis protein)
MARRAAILALLACTLVASGCRRVAEPDGVTLACVGDVMLGRDVARMCERQGDAYPFAQVGDLLSAPDIAFGNLEGVLATRDTRYPRVNALYAPPHMAGVLSRVGFDVLSLANNHAIDCGRAGLLTTIEALQRHGITPVGAGRTAAEAEAGAVVRAGPLRVGFLAYSHFPYTNFVHDPERASILLLDEASLRRTVPALRGRCDCLVVSFHWGQEGVRKPSGHERRLARLALNLGADLVVGHHAHVRGEVQRRGRALVAYCLGNFVFDGRSYGGNEGYILRCRLTADGVEDQTLIPVEVADCQARIASQP